MFRISNVLLNVLIPLALVALLSTVGFCYDLSDHNAPLIQAGMMSKAPVIDGTIGKDEWINAASSNILYLLGSTSVISPAPEIKVGYDRENLYLAVNIPFASGYKIKAVKRDRDGELWNDDTVEVFIDPKHDQQLDYQFSINALGSMGESLNKEPSWNGDWQGNSSQGNNYWQVEIKIPFATLGIDQFDTKKVVGFNIAIDKAFPSMKYYTWAPMSGAFHQPALFGHAILDPSSPGSYANLSYDKASIDIDLGTVQNANNTEAIFTVTDGSISIGDHKQAAAPRAKLSVPIPSQNREAKDGVYKWTSELLQSGSLIYHQAGTVEVRDTPPVALTLRKYFIQGKLAVDADASALELYNQELTARVVITDANGKVTSTKSAKMDSGNNATTEFDMSKDPFTKHTVNVSILNSSGKELTTASQSYTRPPLPGWLHSKAGISNKVMPPWIPMKTVIGRNDIKVSCYGRTYTFGKLPFPSEVLTRGASILSAPLAMKLSVNGKPEQLKGTLQVVSKTPSRVILKGSAVAGALKADSTVTMDYDGNAFVDLKLSASKAVSIDSFIIEAPFKKQHAKYRCYYPGTWESADNARALPAEGWKSDYLPYVWLGDEDRGFALYSVSDQYWSAKDGVKPIEASPVGKSMALRFNIITKPVILSAVQARKGLNFTFGFEATPNKKPEKDVWDYRINHSGSYAMLDTLSGNTSSLQYPVGSAIDNTKGTLEMWVKTCFDPNPPPTDPASKLIRNHDLLSIKTPTQIMGLFWNTDARGMRLYFQDGSVYPIILDSPNNWRDNEIHHLAITWGNRICVYVDGVLTASREWTGLFTGPASDVSVQFAGPDPGFAIDELRISNIERQPVLQSTPYKADEHTILLDHLDKLSKIKNGKLYTIPEKGVPGELSLHATLTDCKFGKAMAILGDRMPTLDYLKNMVYGPLFIMKPGLNTRIILKPSTIRASSNNL